MTLPTALRFALFCCALVASPLRAAAPPTIDGERLFATRVLPVLKQKCFACHGDDAKKLRGGLDLTTREAMLKGGDSGAALIPRFPERSLLHVAVTREQADLVMPPKENDRLSAAEIGAVRAWITAGAPWPSAARIAQLTRRVGEGVRVATSGGLSREWTERLYQPADLWAYRPVQRPAVPAERGIENAQASRGRKRPEGEANLRSLTLPARQQSIRSPIDAFLEAQMKQLGVEPAPPAERQALIRRVTYDLTGLPPTPDEVEAFVRDTAPDAFMKAVDRLLASPAYGEQWGRHWLDVARYADSSGLANDFERGSAWRYRDYVVRAFNGDRPYDAFVREQLAGDEIAPKNPEALVAVGFLRMGPWELTGMEVPKVARQRFLDDVTDTVGQVFLAHPLSCARCHDHKFDPVPTRDYYRIQAAFATTQLAERDAPFLAGENITGFDEKKHLEKRRSGYEKILEGLRAKQEAAARKWCADRSLPYIARAQGLRKGVAESRLPPARVGLDTRDLGLDRISRKGLERLRWEADRYSPVALSVYSGPTRDARAVLTPQRLPADRDAGRVEVTHILGGGDVFSPKERVAPGVLSAVALTRVVPTSVDGRRRALAEWVASVENPLTARVIVNRVWQHHFGRALAGNPNNFGATGKKPTHPELLDWLAAELVTSGWSLKHLHRLILSSAAYQRSSRGWSEAPPESYAAFEPRRLAAEELRDAMLATSGELSREVGGIPVRPEINAETARQPRQVMGTFAPAWQPSPRPQQRHRRSIYALKLQGLRDPFFEAFNQPPPELCAECRETSTVAPQALQMLNSASSAARALAFADRLLRETRTRPEAITRAFGLAFGRPPTAGERTACLAHWEAMTRRHETLQFARAKPATEIVREAVEENTGEKFTYTELLESAADFVPDLHPADVPAATRGLMEVCLVLFNTNEFAYLD